MLDKPREKVRKHIVVVTGSYGKYMSPGSNIIDGVIGNLSKDYDITIISHRDHFEDDRPIITESVSQQYVVDFSTCLHNYCLQKKKNSTLVPSIFWRIVLFFKQMLNAIQMAIRSYGFSTALMKKTVKKLQSIENKHHIDYIIPVSEPHDAVEAAIKFKARNNATKVFIYQLDRFANGNSLYKYKLLKEKAIKRNEEKELEWLKLCDALFVLKPLFNHYCADKYKQYKDKIIVTEHPLVKIKPYPTKKEGSTKNAIVYAGSLDTNLRSPQYWLELFATTIEKMQVAPQCLFYTFGSGAQLVQKYSQANPGAICDCGKVTYAEVKAAYENCAYILIIGNKSEEEVPSKVFDCISYMKPIIYISKVKNDPVIEYIERYPIALCIKEDDSKIEENAEKLIRFLEENRNSYADSSIVARQFADCTDEYVANQFRKVLVRG